MAQPAGDQASLALADVSASIVYLYCFQSWCPGCHSHGFPSLLEVQADFTDSEAVAFVAIRTVFEGFEVNTLEGARTVADRYGLDIPFGHDTGPDSRLSLVMQRYRTGGTPWTVLIDQKRDVRFNGFQADSDDLKDMIGQLLAG
jgi:thiol-disulfide isomerase/thioredoxin